MRNVGDFALNERLGVNQQGGSLDFEDIVMQAMELEPWMNVLDVACGNGHFPLKYARVTVEGSVIGIDQSAELIAQAQEKSDRTSLPAEFRVATAENLPFSDASFHRISCHYALYHFDDIDCALKEMLRTLQPAGKLVISGPAETNNGELYSLHQQAGADVSANMGRQIFQRAVRTFAEQMQLSCRETELANSVTLESVESYLEYYSSTKLFLDNVPDSKRANVLAAAESVLHDGFVPLSITKRIGLFELWN